MATPNKKEIIAKAEQLFMREQYQRDFAALADMKPELIELVQGGFVTRAKDFLMANDTTENELKQYQTYLESVKSNDCDRMAVSEIPFDLDSALESGFYVCGTSGSGKTTLAKFLVETLMCKGVTIFVLDSSQAWNRNSPIKNIVTLRTPLCSNNDTYPIIDTVLDVSRLEIAERFTFANALCKSLMQSRVEKLDATTQPWIFVVFEESQLYLPNGCLRSLNKYGSLLDLLTVGRNFNLRFALITQFSSQVDKAPVKITQQRYFGLSTEKNDLSYLRGFVDKSVLDEIRNLQKGEFVYQNKGKTIKFQCQPYGVVKQENNQSNSYNWSWKL